MNRLILFTDGSVNTKSNIGFGAYVVVPENEMFSENIKIEVKLKRFVNTSSVKLEIETVLWALGENKNTNQKIVIYTDSQNIIGLNNRRARLEKKNYYSKGGKRLNNFELYKQFYQLTDELDCEFVKIKGHKNSKLKDGIDRLFTLVDRASRNAVRGEN